VGLVRKSRTDSAFSPIRNAGSYARVDVVNPNWRSSMDTTLQRLEKQVGTQITKARWALGISGALSIAFGAIIIIWPNISLFSLVIVFGAFALARGIIDLGTAISGSVKEGRGAGSFSRASRESSWVCSVSSGPACPRSLCST
jgi:hypothetical protein